MHEYHFLGVHSGVVQYVIFKIDLDIITLLLSHVPTASHTITTTAAEQHFVVRPTRVLLFYYIPFEIVGATKDI